MRGVPEIVLTGGDCSGKTTGIAYLYEKLMSMGIRVFRVPEVASLIIGGGVHDLERLAITDPEKYYRVEKQMLLMSLDLRKRFQALAAAFPDEKRIILYDRGPMDPFAFMSREMRERLLKDCGLDICQLRDTFDGVIHMVTAAKGAEHGYTRANNPNRQLRTFDEIRSIDDRLIKVWLGNPHYRIVGSRSTFEEKLEHLLKTTCHLAGIPERLEIERKFLIADGQRAFDVVSSLCPTEAFITRQAYVNLPDWYGNDSGPGRIRRRSYGAWFLYYHTKKFSISSCTRKEIENSITDDHYRRLMQYQEKDTFVVNKVLYCFIYQDQVFELQIFQKPEGLCLMEIELLDENDPVELPPFLEIEKEVTSDPRYTSHAIARGSLSQ